MKTNMLLPGCIAGVLFLAASAVFVTKKQRPDAEKRKKHESFLLDVYKKAPPAKKEKGGEGALDEPQAAAFLEYLKTFDPATGKVPRERAMEAYRQTLALSNLKGGSTLDWDAHGSDMGGRTRMIMYDPNDPTQKKVWAGGITGGLWYNPDITNQYSSWVPVGDFWSNLAIRCMAYDPTSTQTFYIGTGEAETAMETYRESSGLGTGIWKSTDGGQTWNQLPSTLNFAYVTKIVVRNEGSAGVIYAGVASGLYKGQQHQSMPSDGLFRSADGGNTWTQVLPDIVGSDVPYCVSDVVLGADDRIYVGSRPNLDGEGGATLLTSDDGFNFEINEDYKTEIENNTQRPIPGRVVLATAPSDANVVYALIASGYVNPSNNFNYFNCYHILRSDDKGVTWFKKNLPANLTSGDNFATIAWHALDVGVDPNEPNRVWVGGLDLHRSENGGNTWQRYSDWSLMYGGGGGMYVHADQHCIVYKPGSSSEALFGSDGGVFYTASATGNPPVMEEHNRNFSTLQFYSCAINPTPGSNNFLGGLQDNGSLSYNGNPVTIFDMVSGGDGAYAFFDENDASVSISSVYYNTYYVYKNGGFLNYIGNWSSGTFVCPADLDYKLNILYCNAVDFVGNMPDKILRLSNLLSNTSGVFMDLNTGSQVCFSAVTYSPYSPNTSTTLFVGSDAGRLFKVTSAHTNTPQVTEIGGTGFPAASISCIAIGGSEDTLCVTFSNYGVTSVWQTTNGGQNWTDREGNLPDMPIRWALYHPDNASHMLLATETGVWETTNINESVVAWQPVNTGMANVRVDMLRIRKSDNRVLAATHGRGLFSATWDIVTGVENRTEASVSVSPNPSPGLVYLNLQHTVPGHAEMVITDARGCELIRESWEAPAGRSTHQADLRNKPAGIYVVSIRLEGRMLATEKILKY
jgi:photosystem II stability/assembly factor-like uncharacterized protein